MDVTLLDKWYPIHLDITGRQCVIVGGGHIALRRIRGLLEAGAHVTVISLHCHPEILQLAAEGSVHVIQQDYRGEVDLVNAELIFAITNDILTNKWVADDAKKLRIPLNHAGDSKSSTFIVPAVIRRGQLIMSVSTSGASPGLSRQIRDELSDQYGDEYIIYIDFLSEFREWVMMKVTNEHDRAKIFHQVLKFDILELIRVDKLHDLRSWLQLVLDQDHLVDDWQQQFKLYMSNQ